MRKTFVLILCCAGLLLAGYASYRGYKVWHRNHLMGLAHGFLAKADERNALLCVQQVLRSDPQNLDATRMMAQLAEKVRSPSALLWRSRVVEINPHSLDDRLALARTALLLRNLAAATNALAGADAADKKTFAYQNEAGTVAVAVNHRAAAEQHFREAARLQPQNPVPRLNLAVLRLAATNTSARAEARATLQKLSANATNSLLRCQALRELLVDAMRHKEYKSSLALSKRLLQETNSAFGDKLLRLDVLQETRHSAFKSELARCRREAATNRARIYALARWQMAQTSPREALSWLRSLPQTQQTNQPVEMLAAECYARLGDWHGLQSWLEPQHWADLEFVRHALMSRALHGQQLADSAKAEWEQALQAANGRKQSLYMLLRMAAQWHWSNESEQLLWDIFNRYPDEKAATKALAQTLYEEGRTRSLMQVFREELQRSPGNLEVKNNLAMTALLLDAKELKPDELAHQVYAAAPTNSAYVSTYAYSLFARGKKSQALKIIDKLTPEQLQDRSIAGYYGIILEANGDREKARAYLGWALKDKLLPEERTLFKNALAKAER